MVTGEFETARDGRVVVVMAMEARAVRIKRRNFSVAVNGDGSPGAFSVWSSGGFRSAAYRAREDG